VDNYVAECYRRLQGTSMTVQNYCPYPTTGTVYERNIGKFGTLPRYIGCTMMEGSDADDVSTAPSFETTSANREFRISMKSL
jgi:hypothetical protein